jgi:hypothetical protein
VRGSSSVPATSLVNVIRFGKGLANFVVNARKTRISVGVK